MREGWELLKEDWKKSNFACVVEVVLRNPAQFHITTLKDAIFMLGGSEKVIIV